MKKLILIPLLFLSTILIAQSPYFKPDPLARMRVVWGSQSVPLGVNQDSTFYYLNGGVLGISPNYVPVMRDNKVFVNSLIYDNATNIGIGTTSPARTLDVIGSGRFSTFLNVNTSLAVGVGGTSTGQIFLANSTNSNYLAISAGIMPSVQTMIMPTVFPSSGQVLTVTSAIAGTIITGWAASSSVTTTKGITMHAGGGQGSATLLTTKYNRIDVCATDHNSGILSSAAVNSFYSVNNVTSKIADVYPASGENFLGLSANVPISIVGGSKVVLICYETGVWTIE